VASRLGLHSLRRALQSNWDTAQRAGDLPVRSEKLKPIDKSPKNVYIHNVKQQLDMSSVRNCTCFNVRRASRAITQFFDAGVRRHGIRPTQTSILGALQAKEGWGMGELSDFLGMERTTLLRNLRPLQRDGLVQTLGGGHGIHVKLEITDKGRAALAKTLPAWRDAQAKVVAILGKERWSAIIQDLENVTAKLKEQPSQK
jgi:DNA-binding MarR family transcriptional regulator